MVGNVCSIILSIIFLSLMCVEPRGDFFEFSGTYGGGEEGKKTVQKNIILIILKSNLN
jgi:hypothetical protein